MEVCVRTPRNRIVRQVHRYIVIVGEVEYEFPYRVHTLPILKLSRTPIDIGTVIDGWASCSRRRGRD